MSKQPLRELESVRITRATETIYIGDRSDNVVLPAGSTGAVVDVCGDPTDPKSYLVEVHLEETDEFAVADVPAEFVELEYTPEEKAVLMQYRRRAREALEEVEALDPHWSRLKELHKAFAMSPPVFADQLKSAEEIFATARARIDEIGRKS